MYFTYRIFGLNFRSNQALPNISPCEIKTDLIDVTIQFEAIKSTFAVIKKEEVFDDMIYRVGENAAGEICTSINFEDIAHYWIENKNSITIEKKLNGADEDVFSFLMSLGLASLFFQREHLVIHAGAISINGEGVLVLGDSGAGKTTTTAKFAKLGFDMLAEDMSLIQFKNNVPYIVSGIPYLKLLPETAAVVGLDWDTLTPLYADASKKAWTLSNYQPQEVPLKKIFWLQTTEGAEIEKETVELEDAFYSLAANIHYPLLFSAYDIDEVCTQKAIAIVEQTKSIILKRPLGKNTMNEIIELIKNETLEAEFAC